MSRIEFPNWVPKLEKHQRILVTGASGGIGRVLISMLQEGSDCILGFHASSSSLPTATDTLIPLQKQLNGEKDCQNLIDEFVRQVQGIDGLVILVGGISNSTHWKNLSSDEWRRDLTLNLDIPFFLARIAMQYMIQQNQGGSIILYGTESALHGGSPTALPYAVAKRGIECLVQGLAREGAKDGITVNGIRPGFISSGFHQRWQGKNDDELQKRAEMVPLKRAGTPEEVAALTIYLLSGWSRFITGQMFAITGGDWL
ncbi:SDR family NAD(P)-dependent oxidoreductase [Phormidium sp. CCY1219]|uniref:SDR family NAD(P)-dependent oxidoreductase n=1 Tax=Phormidium sp. CCY1219 TaxID=2886104 RepID=UPI002D1F82B9|nr:SDR family oxidoreductase [Phormidium sp. CCY1219]MEB3828461.1 SDR family oxidoreductase [Phormidium sp. CCY1219]